LPRHGNTQPNLSTCVDGDRLPREKSLREAPKRCHLIGRCCGVYMVALSKNESKRADQLTHCGRQELSSSLSSVVAPLVGVRPNTSMLHSVVACERQVRASVCLSKKRACERAVVPCPTLFSTPAMVVFALPLPGGDIIAD